MFYLPKNTSISELLDKLLPLYESFQTKKPQDNPNLHQDNIIDSSFKNKISQPQNEI